MHRGRRLPRGRERVRSERPVPRRASFAPVVDRSDGQTSWRLSRTRPGEERADWFETRDRLERALVSILRPRSRDARWGRVQDASVHRDFLEKDQIRWWSVTDLASVIDGRGRFGPERFRPYFLPVLQTILSEAERQLPREPSSPDREGPEDRTEPRTRTELSLEERCQEGAGARRGRPGRLQSPQHGCQCVRLT